VIKHKVHPGETLAQIAADYTVTIDEIRIWNRLEGMPYEGQYLKIVAHGNVMQKDLAKKNISTNNKTVRKPKPKKNSSTTSRKKIRHKVRRGENLSNIAAKYGVSESSIKKWNPGKVKGHTIYAGSHLTIYTNSHYKGSSKSRKRNVKKAPKYYKVRWGDTLQRISRKFGVSVKSLTRKNKNLSNKNLKAGQRIRIQ
jgi:membrane-bound lytic murein transglycosylase D